MKLSLTSDQLDTLRHMLGINTPDKRTPAPSRNYYCASPGDPEMIALEVAGAVERYDIRGGWWWYRCTPAGRQAALDSFKTIRHKRSARVYSAFLDVADVRPDLTFREFLTHPDFAETRRRA